MPAKKLFEITVQRTDGQTPWARIPCKDYRAAVNFGMQFASEHNAWLVSVADITVAFKRDTAARAKLARRTAI